jgi:hypothetical protein
MHPARVCSLANTTDLDGESAIDKQQWELRGTLTN